MSQLGADSALYFANIQAFLQRVLQLPPPFKALVPQGNLRDCLIQSL